MLATCDFGHAVEKELPLLDINENDPELLAALFRDYTFITSAYLLEPCDIQWHKDGTYGLGRSVLPK